MTTSNRRLLLAALLSLDEKYRRALAEQPGPGWWIRFNGYRYPIQESRQGGEHLVMVCPDGPDLEYALKAGWAWLPASEVVVMKAAKPEGWEPRWSGHQWWYQQDITCECRHYASSALDCVLLAWGAR